MQSGRARLSEKPNSDSTTTTSNLFSIGPRPLIGKIGVAAQDLRQLLSGWNSRFLTTSQVPRGLGHHNVLFMAAELPSA